MTSDSKAGAVYAVDAAGSLLHFDTGTLEVRRLYTVPGDVTALHVTGGTLIAGLSDGRIWLAPAP
jgi:hypothetical protein